MRTLVVLLCAALLGGCAAALAPVTLSPATLSGVHSTRPSTVEPALTGDAHRRFHTVYSFVGQGEGKFPIGALIEANGVLFGATRYAGESSGVVFSYTPSGGERVIHNFKRSGESPTALAYLNGALYGTTQAGGAHHAGTVFRLSLSGSKHTIYTFAGGTDGAYPEAIVADGGKLYGTTVTGGSYRFGTFFEVNTSGKKRVLHDFASGSDGTGPVGPLVVSGDTIYGTTSLGGGGPCYSVGCGTVFSIATSGTERTLYAFQGGADGYAPGNLVMMDGTLYGTTIYRGAYNDGTVFALSTSGDESTVYPFNGQLGSTPTGLTGVNHVLYGATAFGAGGGRLFEVTTSGQARSLHHFTGQRSGIEPWGNLIAVGNLLYGVTIHGGENKKGSIYAYAL